MSAALVLETENTDDAHRLASLLRLLAPQIAKLEELVVTHHGLDDETRRLLDAAGAHAITFVALEPSDGYYEAKNAGFSATRADVVAFADSDCVPCDDWLAQLFAPFARPEVQVVAGRTVYAPHALADALTAVDFTMFPSALGAGCVRHFFANNVAFRRDVFAARPYEARGDTRRGACGVLAFALHREGIGIHYAPDARTRHAAPSTVRELTALRRHRGADIAALAPAIADAHLPLAWRWLGRCGHASAAALLLGRAVTSLRALDHARVRGAAGILVVTLLDAVGAVSR
jgi:glycosyltransferase involved in cell wall biosynthesis